MTSQAASLGERLSALHRKAGRWTVAGLPEGADAWVVVPKNPLPGNPCSWCLMFPDAFTERCAAPGLVARGFHHAFLDVGNSFGSPAAVAKLARFHDELVRRGLLAEGAQGSRQAIIEAVHRLFDQTLGRAA